MKNQQDAMSKVSALSEDREKILEDIRQLLLKSMGKFNSNCLDLNQHCKLHKLC